MKRTAWLIIMVLLCTMMMVLACQSPPNILPTPVPPEPVTPPEPTEPTAMPSWDQRPPDEPLEGRSGPKRGEELPPPDLPAKDSGAELLPINPERGSKLPPDEVVAIEPGTAFAQGDRSAKPPPGDELGIPGEGPKESSPEASRARHARVQFNYSRIDGIVPEVAVVVPDELVPSTTIDGELFYVFAVNGEPVHVGSFQDPLYMVGLPKTRDQGYSRVELDQGTFTIAIPELLLEPDLLAASVLEFYRLGPDIPYDTPLTVRTVGAIMRASELLYTVRGSQLVEVPLEYQ